ncbi:LapD/MoxY N-terminal periplasmic domain-containing protein [Halioxenophilus sp. WMMB6]|uniref:nSTAND1 domain-containing NTPase n=1 Tax=Halioxenophilus sp. WMMB6 TaxID=3073815 RepID=UPI00295F4BC7|nr:LapD/MoxY N-terminal periplasmic domain-containing protein [Halioxenophilus sp. WMMB6]
MVAANLKIFIAAPADVAAERQLVLEAIEQLAVANTEFADIELVSWQEAERLTLAVANQGPQVRLHRQVVEPADCDLVVVIFWGQIGEPLPSPDLVKDNGEAYLSCTEWEFENALHSPKQPRILVYRRTDPILLTAEDANLDEALKQQQQVNLFFKRFDNGDASLRGYYHKYHGIEQFHAAIAKDLVTLVRLADYEKTKELAQATWQQNPYCGLLEYNQSQADIFYGREAEIESLCQKFINGCQLLALVGDSGVGKSSLMRAGVAPYLAAPNPGGQPAWQAYFTRPNHNDFLAEFGEQCSDASVADTINEVLGSDESGGQLLYVIDQAEELLAVEQPLRQKALAAINGLLACNRVAVVLICRSDFYLQLQSQLSLEIKLRLQEETFFLFEPTASQLLDIVQKPIQKSGFDIDTDVVANILVGLQNPRTSLAHLSLLMSRLVEEAEESRAITFKHFAKVGGLQAIIADEAEAVYDQLTDEQKARFTVIFSQLILCDEQQRYNRVSQPYAHFSHRFAEELVLERFLEARLLTMQEESGGERTIELVHDSLLLYWPRLKSLADEQRQLRLWREEVHLTMSRWQRSNEPQHLLRGANLSRAEALQYADAQPWSAEEITFIEASLDYRNSIVHKIGQLFNSHVGMLLIGLVVLTGGLWLLVQQTAAVTSQQLQSDAQQLAVALANRWTQPLTQPNDSLTPLVKAEFNRGQYQALTLQPMNGETITFSRPEADHWLAALLEANSAEAPIVMGDPQAVLGSLSLSLDNTPYLQALTRVSLISLAIIALYLVLIGWTLVSLKGKLKRLQLIIN